MPKPRVRHQNHLSKCIGSKVMRLYRKTAAILDFSHFWNIQNINILSPVDSTYLEDSTKSSLMKFGSWNVTNLRISQNMGFSLAAILKMAQNTTFAMENSPETCFLLKSTIKGTHKNWIWRIMVHGNLFKRPTNIIMVSGGHLGSSRPSWNNFKWPHIQNW